MFNHPNFRLCLGVAGAIVALATSPPLSAEDPFADVDFRALDGSHDLTLPDWGPYTKGYIGVSHIPDADKGMRFDLSVFPGYYRRKTMVPNVFFDSDFHPWRADPGLEYFEFRHDIQWKDQVYADISYSADGDDARIVRARLVNNTGMAQSLALHFAASLNFPAIAPYKSNIPLRIGRVRLPQDGVWIDGIDYHALDYARPRADDNLVYDGWRRGEVRAHGFVAGAGVGRGFGADTGDRLSFVLQLPRAIDGSVVVVRYRSTDDSPASFALGGAAKRNVTLPASATLRTVAVDAGPLAKGRHELTLTSRGSGAIELDGIAIVRKEEADSIQFDEHSWNPVASITEGPVDNSVILNYSDTDTVYGIRWYFDETQIRELHHSELTGFYERIANTHVRNEFHGDGEGHYLNLYMRPINLAPNSVRDVYALVTAGEPEAVRTRLARTPDKPDKFSATVARARETVPALSSIPSGEHYRFAVEKMAATLVTNIVYPVYTQQQYIRHSAPGRYWDSLYTWDSGFIGIGLLELDLLRSLENLNAYLTAADSQSAFIHHGTPLPVQHYQFLELWNRTQSLSALRYAYPKLRRYYLFLTGEESSSTDTLDSGLLKTWDYFYNSGGWDDLPPQKFVHENDLASRTAPVVTSAHVIRIAKILLHAARRLGETEHIPGYRSDISRLEAALQQYAWNEETGYFSYVLHDSEGNPVGPLRDSHGENLSKTLDGVSPLIAGSVTAEQRRRLLNALKDPDRLFSEIGLTAVDQSAGYYSGGGYWNGTVWMPHQWFIWKSLLDLGEHQFARKVAITALDLWKRETEATYNSSEHFVIATGRSAGWHQFGALSAPVLSWYGAYFTPGRITVGLDAFIEDLAIGDDHESARAEIRFHPRRGGPTPRTVLVTLDESSDYVATWNDTATEVITYAPGSMAVQIPPGATFGVLTVSPR